jgi:uncharacterized RDD family membrane protein YckC
VTEAGRYALIVATSSYRDAKLRRLRAPATDAEQLAHVLRDPQIGDFEVEVVHDPDEPALRRRLARFFANRRPEDLLFLHFSCHGVKDDRGELHLATTDTEMDLLDATSISSAWLDAQLGRTRSKRVVVLLDCCFSGSFPFGVRPRAGADVDVRGALNGRGRVVITASSAMEYAFEGDRLAGEGQPSIFTSAVIDALASGRADRDQDRLISIDELYDYVFEQVKTRTPAQSPQMMSSLEGPLYLARSSWIVPVEATAVDPPAPAIALPGPAAWSVRARAAALDGLLGGLIGLIPAAQPWSGQETMPWNGVFLWIALALFGGGLAYTCFFLGSHPGRTLGKRAYGLLVSTAAGAPVSRGRLVGRELLRWTMLALIGASFGLLLAPVALFVRKRSDGRPPHDVLAGTTVQAVPLRY